MAWATAAEVLALTGASATDAQILQAHTIVELYGEVTQESDETLSSRDLRLLKLATVYQCAWMISGAHPDLFSRTQVSELTQDQVSGKLAHDQALMLAPLANQALIRLSWMRPGAIKVERRAPLTSLEAWQEAFLRDQEPAQYWLPMFGQG